MTNKNKIPPQFIVRIPVRNQHGAVTGEREFITYAGLLAVAHEIGLDEIDTAVIKLPSESDPTAAVRALVKGKTGVFSGLGDATPANCNRKVAPHLLRVAETRAKARALRDFCNINMLALEELGDEDIDFVRAANDTAPQRPPHRRDGHGAGISDAQKRALWRKALTLGHEGQAAHAFLTSRLGADPAKATREQASKLLDALSIEERQLVNGHGHAAE
jgi:hypothetical protein